MEEGGPASNGMSICEIKKLKKESAGANDVLSGSDASIIDILDGFIHTLSQSKHFDYVCLVMLLVAYVWIIVLNKHNCDLDYSDKVDNQ